MDFEKLLSRTMEVNLDLPKMIFTVWDVGHGLSIWIKTPNGHNHWIDAGSNSDEDFSPAKHVHEHHGEKKLDYLIISHPDKDHIENLPDLLHYFGLPRTLERNRTLPTSIKYGDGSFEYQKAYKELDSKFINIVPFEMSPENPNYNGGIEVMNHCLDFQSGMAGNNTSVVTFYFYAGHLFICPGDIEPEGWIALWKLYSTDFQPLISKAKTRILIAPHHGRKSGYSEEMMEKVVPHLVVVCDKWGGGETDSRFRERPLGLNLNGSMEKYKSTKTTGRLKFTVRLDGAMTFSEI